MRPRTDSRPTRNPPGARARRRARAGRPLRWVSAGVALLALALIASAVSRVVVPRASAAEVKVGARAPDLAFTAAGGVQHRLSELRGRPVLLWLLATWCPSCQAGTAAVARRLPELVRTRLRIVQLRLYGNLGYPGRSMAEFVRAYAGPAGASPRWLWGDAAEAGSYTYDPRGYPDVYFLIDSDGVIRAIDSAPGVTIERILSFARDAR